MSRWRENLIIVVTGTGPCYRCTISGNNIVYTLSLCSTTNNWDKTGGGLKASLHCTHPGWVHVSLRSRTGMTFSESLSPSWETLDIVSWEIFIVVSGESLTGLLRVPIGPTVTEGHKICAYLIQYMCTQITWYLHNHDHMMTGANSDM